MTPEKQRIAIARACPGVVTVGAHSPDTFFFSRSGWAVEFDPLNDLNAMHEAESTIRGDHDKWAVYLHHLSAISYYCRVYSTAAQRAEAFLRTISKWEESA